MTKLILAISPDLNLLNQISAHLQEGGRFQVFCVANGKDALTLAAIHPFNLAILDAETNDLPFIPLTRELVGLLPELKLLIYPPQNNLHHPVLHGVIANGYLNKPFFGPEVNEKIMHALNETNPLKGPVTTENTLTRLWVEQPVSGQHQVEQLLASTSANTGILLLHRQVIAVSGPLSDENSHNVISFLTRYWTNIQSGELFRYLKMEGETKTYLVYATPLFKEAVLALIYHANLPLIDIRNEVSLARKAFLNQLSDSDLSVSNSPVKTEVDISTVPPPSTRSLSETTPLSPIELDIPNEADSLDPETEPSKDEEEQTGLSDLELKNLDALITEMPSPDPEDEDETEPDLSPNLNPLPIGGWLKITSDDLPTNSKVPPAALNQQTSGITRPLTPPAESPQEIRQTAFPAGSSEPTQPVKSSEFPDFDFTLPWEGEEAQNTPAADLPFEAPPLPANEKIQMFDEQPKPVINNPAAVFFEYQIMLLPRDPQQFITHDLAELLNRQLPRLHESNGWQCTGLSIRPLYMLWTAVLPADTCLHEMVEEIKESTDIQIFAGFPALLLAHPEGEFWARGYFSISGSKSLSNRLINDYISLSRQVFSRLVSD
jgi:DNA-binding response OmpR family regulator